MHRNRTWTLDPPEWRTQRNRLLPIEGGDGSTLNLDFTKGVLDPRITFSRLSTATFVNSSGYVEYAGANLCPYSQQINVGTWLVGATATLTPNTTDVLDPQGGNTATKISLGANAYNSRAMSLALPGGMTYTFSYWIRGTAGNQCRIYSNAGYVGDLVTETSYSYSTTEWTRVSTTFTTNVATTNVFLYVCAKQTFPATTDVIYVWGAQINPGSTAQTYYPTTTAAYHAPRFDYSPTNIGEPRGLLVEGQATNLARFSEDCGNSGNGFWSITGAGSTLNSQTKTSPANTSKASEISFGISTNSNTYVYVATTAVTYTGSIYLRLVSGNPVINLRVYNNTTGIATLTPITITSTWARYSVSFTGGASFVEFGVQSPHATTVVVDIWGAQVELGSGASSFIPTVASTVQRVADNCFMSGINSWFNESAGTVITNCTYNAGASDNAGIELSVGTGTSATNRIGIRKLYVDYYSGGANSAEMNIPTQPALENKRIIATTYSANSFAICGNSGTVVTDSSGAVPVGLNTLKLYSDAGTETLNGTLKSIKYFPTRFTNAQLQTITSPQYVAPTLDINFTTMSTNADLTAKGITFTRLSNATMVNANGFVVSAPSNLIINSVLAGGSTSTTALSNPTGWLVGIGGTSYRSEVVINSCNQWVQTASNQRPFITINVPQADLKPEVQYVASVYVDELSTGDNFNIIGAMLYYNAPTGTTVSSVQWVLPSGQTTNDGSGTLTTGLLQLRFKLSVVGVSGFQIRIGIGTYANATGAVAFSRPQVEQAFSATSYIPNTSTVAPFYGPRFNYSPTNIGEPQGLLLEGQAVNYLPFSNTLQGGSWFTGGNNAGGTITITNPYTATNPANGSTCTRLQFAVADGGGSPRLYYITSQTSPYTTSLWMKSNTSGNHTLSLYQNDTWVNFTVTPTWQRFQTTRTSGSALVGFFMLANNSTSLMPDILVYGAQLETGSGATSYIPTGSSTVTRNADDCLLTGTNFSSWYNPKEGSTFVQWTGGSGTNVSDGRSYTLLNTTQTNQIFENGSYGLNVYLSDFQAQIGSSLGTGSSAAKVASAFKQADFATSVNGSSAEVKTSGSMPTLVDRLSIGGNYLNAASYKFANFKQFTYYPIRLTNTQLKALTS